MIEFGGWMGLLFKQFFTLLKLLNSDTGQNQIAAGAAAGFILGMTPAFSLQTILVIFCIFLFRVQISMAFLCAFLFSFFGWLLDPIFHKVGGYILTSPSLIGLWTTMYNLPIVPYTRFNNTIVMGSGVISILLSPVVFFVTRSLVIRYRETIVARLKETKLWKAVKATAFYKWYYTYDKLYG
jgi:uncharacterized protein (TIGR03546 family)